MGAVQDAGMPYRNGSLDYDISPASQIQPLPNTYTAKKQPTAKAVGSVGPAR